MSGLDEEALDAAFDELDAADEPKNETGAVDTNAQKSDEVETADTENNEDAAADSDKETEAPTEAPKAEEEQVNEEEYKKDANARIRQLLEEKKAAEDRLAAYEAAEQAKEQQDEKPDPVDELKKTLEGLMSPKELAASEQINPDTGERYTYAEAVAVIARTEGNLRWQIDQAEKQQMAETQSAQTAARTSEEFGAKLTEAITKHPEFNPQDAKYDPAMAKLAERIFAADIQAGADGRVIAYKTPPELIFEEIKNAFGERIKQAELVRANGNAKLGAKATGIDGVSSRKVEDAAPATFAEQVEAALDNL